MTPNRTQPPGQALASGGLGVGAQRGGRCFNVGLVQKYIYIYIYIWYIYIYIIICVCISIYI